MRVLLNVLFERATCLSSPYAVEEARRNLHAKSPEGLSALADLVKGCEKITAISAIPFDELPPKDAPILGAAVAAGATHLLTGDEKHFGIFWGKTIHDVKIVSPRMIAEELGLL
jgi:uncharacterized protein